MKLILTTAAVLALGFSEAFDRLCAQNIPVKDRYALARVRRELASHRETFREQHLALVKKHGEPEIGLLERRLGELKAAMKPGDQPSAYQRKADARLAALKEQQVESYAVDERNAAVFEPFSAALKELNSVSFEVFIDHKIALPESTDLTGVEIDLLLDLVEIAKPAEAK